MKHGTRPTLKQKLIIEAAGEQPADWLVEREVKDDLALIHKDTRAIKFLRKSDVNHGRIQRRKPSYS